MPRKPLGWMGVICQAQDATRPEGGSQTPNHRDKEKQTGGVRLARTPCLAFSVLAAVRRSACPNPADAPQRSSPARAAHKITIDHEPKTSPWLGETGPGLLDQGEGDCRVRGADQLVWSKPRARCIDAIRRRGRGQSKRGYRPGLRPPRGYFQKDEIDCRKRHINVEHDWS